MHTRMHTPIMWFPVEKKYGQKWLLQQHFFATYSFHPTVYISNLLCTMTSNLFFFLWLCGFLTFLDFLLSPPLGSELLGRQEFHAASSVHSDKSHTWWVPICECRMPGRLYCAQWHKQPSGSITLCSHTSLRASLKMPRNQGIILTLEVDPEISLPSVADTLCPFPLGVSLIRYCTGLQDHIP